MYDYLCSDIIFTIFDSLEYNVLNKFREVNKESKELVENYLTINRNKIDKQVMKKCKYCINKNYIIIRKGNCSNIEELLVKYSQNLRIIYLDYDCNDYIKFSDKIQLMNLRVLTVKKPLSIELDKIYMPNIEILYANEERAVYNLDIYIRSDFINIGILGMKIDDFKDYENIDNNRTVKARAYNEINNLVAFAYWFDFDNDKCSKYFPNASNIRTMALSGMDYYLSNQHQPQHS